MDLPKLREELHKRVDGLLQQGGQLPTEDREWLLENVKERAEGYEYGDGDPDLQEVIGQEIAGAIMEHRRLWAREPSPIEEPVSEKAYWRLLADLDPIEDEIINPTAGPAYPWKPITVGWDGWGRSVDWASRQPRILLEFDHRISQRSLVAQLRHIWPTLLKCGYLRQTRTLKPKSINLIRLICLELPPGTKWSERLSAWNRQHKPKYELVSNFQRDFRRAEEQLTGERYGLEHLYNPVARLGDDELRKRREEGDRQALAYDDRRQKRQAQRRAANLLVAECSEAPPAWDSRPFDRRSR